MEQHGIHFVSYDELKSNQLNLVPSKLKLKNLVKQSNDLEIRYALIRVELIIIFWVEIETKDFDSSDEQNSPNIESDLMVSVSTIVPELVLIFKP